MNMQRILSSTDPAFDEVTKRWGAPPTVPAAAPLRPTSPLSVADAAAYNASPEGRATAVEPKMNAAKAKVPNAFTGPAAANPATTKAPNASTGPAAAKNATMAGRVLNADVGAVAKQTLRSGVSMGKSIMQSPLTPAALATGAMAGAATGYNTSTDQYRLRMGMDPHGSTGGDLAARGVGVMADVGDALTFGQASRLGNYIAGNDAPAGAASNAPAAPGYKPTPDSVQPWGNEAGRSVSNINAPGGNIRGAEDFTDRLNGAKGPLPTGLRDGMVYKTKDAQGRVTYSGNNVSGDVSNKMLNGDGTSAGKMRGSLRSGNDVTFGPNGSYVIDDQAKAMSAERIKQTMTNPDGSAWSAQDNAVMAANLRDGVDPYRGTSRQAPPVDDAPKRGEFGYKTYMLNKQKDADRAVTLRGQEKDLAVALATKGTARDRLAWDMERETRTDARTAEAHDQTVGTKARENAMKEFRVFDTKDPSKVDEAASQASFDAVRQIFPGIDSADEATRNKFMPDAKEMHAIFQKARSQDKVGMDAMRIWQPKRPALNSMPDAKGLRDEQVGPFEGAITLGASNGDVLLKRPDGTSLNLGRLNERQRELLAIAQKSGWGK